MRGNWKKDKKLKDDEDFGKGKLGVRARKVDPSKAMDMDVDSVTSNAVKVSFLYFFMRVAQGTQDKD